MKVYRTRFHDKDEGTILSWHASKREAEAALRELQAGRGQPQGVEDVQPVNIRTDRAGLLCFLAIHCNRDNG
jgi:hypothetical protein